MNSSIETRNWRDLLEILGLQKKPWMLCLDEFPYLAAKDSSLPSRLQRWLDHDMPNGCLLVLSGSSMSMMHALFLHRAAPLDGRASKLMQLGPMDYPAFCRACRLEPAAEESFEKFACVGGIPKYWEFTAPDQDVIGLAEALCFDFAPYMEQEPGRILNDEGLPGANALAVFEDWCRLRYPGAGRYLDKTVELDLLAPDPEQANGLLVGEVKWRRLSRSERAAILRDLRDRWHRSALAFASPWRGPLT